MLALCLPPSIECRTLECERGMLTFMRLERERKGTTGVIRPEALGVTGADGTGALVGPPGSGEAVTI